MSALGRKEISLTGVAGGELARSTRPLACELLAQMSSMPSSFNERPN